VIRNENGTSYTALNALIARAANWPDTAVVLTDEQALSLHRRWNAALSTRLDYALEFHGDRPAREAVASAWLALRDDQQVLRSLIDAHGNRAATAAAADQEAAMVALAASIVGPAATPRLAAAAGRGYLARVRSFSPGEGAEHARTA